MANDDIGNCYHHSQTFSRELEKINNSRAFSFADYSCYTVFLYNRIQLKCTCIEFTLKMVAWMYGDVHNKILVLNM